MGNLCSKQTNNLPNSNTASTSISNSSLELIYDFELCFDPRSGEGESVKVLLAYLDLPFREKIEYGSSTTLNYREGEIRGTLPCLRYLCKRFRIHTSDIYTTEEVCSQIVTLWRQHRDYFLHNNRAKIYEFYTQKLPLFLRMVETQLKEDSLGIVGNQVTMCDILTVTFVYNLFYRGAYPHVLRENAPKLMDFCLRFIKNHVQGYFSSRTFSLYI